MLLDRFGVWELYDGAPEKRANLQLFLDFADDFCDPALPPARQLSALLELSALSSSELDRMSRSANKVAVITAHQSKGCEFDYVFLPVLQEGVFPTFQAARSGELEEEKRVFYVSITRARKKLFLTWSRCRDEQLPIQAQPLPRDAGVKKRTPRGPLPSREAAPFRCSFFSCKKELKNTPEGWGFRACGRGAGPCPAAPQLLKLLSWEAIPRAAVRGCAGRTA